MVKVGSLPAGGGSNLPKFSLFNFVLVYACISLFFLVIFLVKNRQVRGLSLGFSGFFLATNLFFFSKLASYGIGSFLGGELSLAPYVSYSGFFLLIFMYIVRRSSLRGLMLSPVFLSSLFFFFYFGAFIVATENLVDAVLVLEFLNIFVFTFLVSASAAALGVGVSRGSAASANIRYGTVVRLANALLGLFFLVFLVGIFFFFFFLNFLYVYLGRLTRFDFFIFLKFFTF